MPPAPPAFAPSELFVPLEPAPRPDELPARFPSPFDVRAPHPLVTRAATQLTRYLAKHEPLSCVDEGKMFAVLVVATPDGRVGLLRGFSGMLHGSWLAEGFVPPLFDFAAREPWWSEAKEQLRLWDEELRALTEGDEVTALRAEHAALIAAQTAELEAMKLRHRERKEARRSRRREIEAGDQARGEVALGETREATAATAATDAELRRRADALRALDLESSRDGTERKHQDAAHRAARATLEEEVTAIDQRRSALSTLRAESSARYQRRLHELYLAPSAAGAVRSLPDIYAPGKPPGGAGDCAGPKLLAYALRNDMRPLALAELWWGPPPVGGGRHHGQLYPACRGKCGPLLPHMLLGLDVEEAPIFGATTNPDPGSDPDPDPGSDPDAATVRALPITPSSDRPFGPRAPQTAHQDLQILYEDPWLLAIAKPRGLLSVPGRTAALQDSVLTRLRTRFPHLEGPLLVHRLDLDTSGLLIAAKTPAIHARLQRLFVHRDIDKRYLAILDGSPATDRGIIDLALRTDIDDRPRQIHDPLHGKRAITHWHVLARSPTTTRAALFPHTGRTHQLRVHAAHPLGLACPILGDRLYGRPGPIADSSSPPVERLMLHAERLAFPHPHTGARLDLLCESPF